MRWHDTGEGIESIQFTMAMLAVFVAVFGAELMHRELGFLHAFPWRVADGEPWRLLTSTALHGSIFHIVFNAYWFFIFSAAIERWLGPWITMLMYIFFAVASGAAQLLWSGGIGAIGASGVVYGLFGFLWVTRRRYDIAAEVTPPQTILIMLAWLGICFVLNLFGSPIANVAHLFGLLFGWLLGQVVVARRQYRVGIIAGMACLWLLLLAMTYRPVWQQTAARLPFLGSDENTYFFNMPAGHRPEWEQAAQRRGPGLY